MDGHKVAVAAGLILAAGIFDRLQVAHSGAFFFTLGNKLLNGGILQIGGGLLNGRLVRKIIGLLVVFIAVDFLVFHSKEGGIVGIRQISIFLVLIVFIDDSVVVALLVPSVVRLEDNTSLDAGIHQQHDYHDHNQQGENGKEYAL